MCTDAVWYVQYTPSKDRYITNIQDRDITNIPSKSEHTPAYMYNHGPYKSDVPQ